MLREVCLVEVGASTMIICLLEYYCMTVRLKKLFLQLLMMKKIIYIIFNFNKNPSLIIDKNSKLVKKFTRLKRKNFASIKPFGRILLS